MENQKRRRKDPFPAFEKLMTKIILFTAVVFAMMLAAGGNGVLWLKITLAVPVLLVSALGNALLFLKREHKRPRSRWMLASFVSLLAVTLVSLIVNYPA